MYAITHSEDEVTPSGTVAVLPVLSFQGRYYHAPKHSDEWAQECPGLARRERCIWC